MEREVVQKEKLEREGESDKKGKEKKLKKKWENLSSVASVYMTPRRWHYGVIFILALLVINTYSMKVRALCNQKKPTQRVWSHGYLRRGGGSHPLFALFFTLERLIDSIWLPQ